MPLHILTFHFIVHFALVLFHLVSICCCGFLTSASSLWVFVELINKRYFMSHRFVFVRRLCSKEFYAFCFVIILTFHRFLVRSRLNMCACVWFSWQEIVHVYRFSYCNWMILAYALCCDSDLNHLKCSLFYWIICTERKMLKPIEWCSFQHDLYLNIWTKSSQTNSTQFDVVQCACIWPTTTSKSHFNNNSFNHLSFDPSVCVCVVFFLFLLFVFWIRQFTVSVSLVCSWNLLKRQIGSKDLLSVGNAMHTHTQRDTYKCMRIYNQKNYHSYPMSERSTVYRDSDNIGICGECECIFFVSNRNLLSRKSKMKCFIPIENTYAHRTVHTYRVREKYPIKWNDLLSIFALCKCRKLRVTETCFAYLCKIILMISVQQLNSVLKFLRPYPSLYTASVSAFAHPNDVNITFQLDKKFTLSLSLSLNLSSHICITYSLLLVTSCSSKPQTSNGYEIAY